MSINITVASSTGGSFSATAVTTDNTTVVASNNLSGNAALTVEGGIGPPGVGNVAIAPGTGIAIATVANVATISSTVQGVPASNLADLADVDATTPASGQVLEWNGTAWAPGLDSTLTLSNTGGSDLGVSNVGISSEAARADHVHNLPTFAEITNGTATVTGNLTLNASTGEVIVNGGTSSGSLTLNCEQNTHGVTIASPAHSVGASYTLTLPATAGSANQVLTTDGSGSLSWSNGTGGGISWTTPAPGNSSDAGTAGAVAYSGQYFFLHNGTQWNRVQLSAFGSTNVATYNLLSEGGDTLATEAGSQLAYDGLGSYPGGGGSATLTFSSQPSSQEITATAVSTTVTFNATATHSDGDAVSYQWQELPPGGSWANLSGETYDNLSLTAYQGSSRRQYRVLAIAGSLQETSNAAELTMHTQLFANPDLYVADFGGSSGIPMEPTHYLTGTYANTVIVSDVTVTDTTDAATVQVNHPGTWVRLEVFKDGSSVASTYNSTGNLRGFYWDGSAYQFFQNQYASSNQLPPGNYRVTADVVANGTQYSGMLSSHPFDV